MKKNIKSLLIGIIIGVIIATSSVFAITGSVQKTLDYNNIKITLNGNEITPTDANGTYVEPFTIEGTTYLPVRAIAGALGLDVDWDETTSTVILGKDVSAGKADGNIIYEDDYVKITYTGVISQHGESAYNLLIENKSDKTFYIGGDDVYVNGFAANSFSDFGIALDPGKKSVNNIRIWDSLLDNCGIPKVEEIEFKVTIREDAYISDSLNELIEIEETVVFHP